MTDEWRTNEHDLQFLHDNRRFPRQTTAARQSHDSCQMVVRQYSEQDDHCTNVAQWTVSQSFIFCKCSTTTSRSQHEPHDKDKMFVDNTSITQRGTTMVGDNTRQWDNNKPNTTNANRHARLRHDGYFRISHLYKRLGPTPGSLSWLRPI